MSYCGVATKKQLALQHVTSQLAHQGEQSWMSEAGAIIASYMGRVKRFGVFTSETTCRMMSERCSVAITKAAI